EQSKACLVQRLTAGRFGKNTNSKRRRSRRFKLQPKAHEQGQDHSQPDADGEAPRTNWNLRYSGRLLRCCRNHGNASRYSSSVSVSRHIDRGDEAVATSMNIDDEPTSVPTVTQRASQRRHVDREVGGVDEKFGPNASSQVLLADKLAL